MIQRKGHLSLQQEYVENKSNPPPPKKKINKTLSKAVAYFTSLAQKQGFYCWKVNLFSFLGLWMNAACVTVTYCVSASLQTQELHCLMKTKNFPFPLTFALHPRPELWSLSVCCQAKPETSEELIQDEVRRQVCKCTCVKQFKIHKIGEGKYRVSKEKLGKKNHGRCISNALNSLVMHSWDSKCYVHETRQK